MSSTSEKHNNFICEPMGKKKVTELAGVDEALGQRLQSAGYDKAASVLGQYLVFNRNANAFIEWMQKVGNANAEQSEACFRCLDEWSKEFL